MKIFIVNSSAIQAGTGCLLANRYVGTCHECDRIMWCPNEQAKEGRMYYLRMKEKFAEERLQKIRDLIATEEQKHGQDNQR